MQTQTPTHPHTYTHHLYIPYLDNPTTNTQETPHQKPRCPRGCGAEFPIQKKTDHLDQLSAFLGVPRAALKAHLVPWHNTFMSELHAERELGRTSTWLAHRLKLGDASAPLEVGGADDRKRSGLRSLLQLWGGRD